MGGSLGSRSINQAIAHIVENSNFFDDKNLIWQTGKTTFEEFKSVLSDNIVYYIPEIKTSNFYTPEKKLNTKKGVLEYWGALHQEIQPEISRFEYLKIGKQSEVRCFYEKHHYVLDVQLYFDEYGIVYKIINSLFRTAEEEIKRKSGFKEKLNDFFTVKPLPQMKNSLSDSLVKPF